MLKEIINVSNTASKDESRDHLCGVHLQAVKGRVQIQSTDGHCMSRLMIDAPSVSFLETLKTYEGGVLIHRDHFGQIKAAFKSLKKLGHIAFRIEGGRLNINDQYLVPVQNMEHVRYPNLDRVMANPSEVTISLNAELLMRISKAIAGPGKGVRIHINPDNSHAPLLIESGDKGASATLMPMRSV